MSDRTQSTTGPPAGTGREAPLRYPSAKQWANACTVFLILMGLVFAFVVDFLLPDVRDLPFVRDNLPIAESELHRNHVRLVGITKAAMVVGALAAITWLVWQFLAHANARALSGRKGKLVPALGVVCWIIPGVNFILPPFVMQDMLRASDPDSVSSKGRLGGWASLVVLLWWTGWLVGGALLYVAFLPVLEGHPTPSDLITRDHFAIAASLVAIPTALLGAVLLHQVNARQVLKEDRLVYREWVGWSDTA
ncbi:MAG TPA: DUF4328 domain-containing protein [Actinomycetota bacterium]